MEVEDPEHRVLFLEEAATKDACAEESAPGIVPDGENVFCDGYSLVWGGDPHIHMQIYSAYSYTSYAVYVNSYSYAVNM